MVKLVDMNTDPSEMGQKAQHISQNYASFVKINNIHTAWLSRKRRSQADDWFTIWQITEWVDSPQVNVNTIIYDDVYASFAYHFLNII